MNTTTNNSSETSTAELSDIVIPVHGLSPLWPHRLLLAAILVALIFISLPIHYNRQAHSLAIILIVSSPSIHFCSIELRMAQMNLSYDVRGRGVLWLTVIEQRFSVACGALAAAQAAILATGSPLPLPACFAFGWAVEVLNINGLIGGTSIVVCR